MWDESGHRDGLANEGHVRQVGRLEKPVSLLPGLKSLRKGNEDGNRDAACGSQGCFLQRRMDLGRAFWYTRHLWCPRNDSSSLIKGKLEAL